MHFSAALQGEGKDSPSTNSLRMSFPAMLRQTCSFASANCACFPCLPGKSISESGVAECLNPSCCVKHAHLHPQTARVFLACQANPSLRAVLLNVLTRHAVSNMLICMYKLRAFSLFTGHISSERRVVLYLGTVRRINYMGKRIIACLVNSSFFLSDRQPFRDILRPGVVQQSAHYWSSNIYRKLSNSKFPY